MALGALDFEWPEVMIQKSYDTYTASNTIWAGHCSKNHFTEFFVIQCHYHTQGSLYL